MTKRKIRRGGCLIVSRGLSGVVPKLATSVSLVLGRRR